MMKKLLVGLLVVGASAVAVATTISGCADSCTDLNEICGRCTDANYAESCRQVVNEGNQEVCSGQAADFAQFCQGGGGGVGGSIAGCAPGTVVCGGTCVDLDTSVQHCGTCNNGCVDPAPLCAAGDCVASCPAAFVECSDGACIDPTNDPSRCGGCDGPACPPEVCSDGSCVPACDQNGATPTDCNGSCVNLANDPLNCGVCGNACGAGSVCTQGQCADSCVGGETQCCGKCVDTLADPSHCGGCDPSCVEVTQGATAGEVCPDGDVCNQGTCAVDCGSLTECAGGFCVDTNDDPSHCGGCNNLCAPGTVCSGGSCVTSGCPAGLEACGGSCVALQEDANNCGACGNTCLPGLVCNHGRCEASCTDPTPSSTADDYQQCGLSCVDVNSHADHCGSCDNACPSGQVCSAGVCAATCGSGLTLCNGACVDTTSHFDNCGGCGISCNDANICTADSCNAGQCANDSGALVCNDGNQCTQDQCDPVTGCYASPVTQQQLAQLCPGAGPDDCLFCDPNGAACNVLARDDGIDCTVDVCPPGTIYSPDAINVEDDTWCTSNASCTKTCDKTLPAGVDSHGCVKELDGDPGEVCTAQCAGVCDPDLPGADATTGCVEVSNAAPCTASCASECNPNKAPLGVGETIDPITGCVELSGATGVCNATCALECNPNKTNLGPGQVIDPVTGCIETSGLAPCNFSCATVCNPNGTPGPNQVINSTTGCVENSALCSCGGTTCDPTDPNHNSCGCL